MLDREELVEQAYFFRVLGERLLLNMPMQEVLAAVREEILSTTKLPMAIDYMLGELRHSGAISVAMERLTHYFTPFQTFLVREAENERGRFDLRVALEVLRRECAYRAEGATPQGLFVYQFETLCRNRLGYDRGLAAVAADPMYDENWREWILTVRRQVGIVDFADMIYVRSQYYLMQRARRGEQDAAAEKPMLFGEKEGKIALANRQKDPLFLFSALQRQLNYPVVPRPKPPDEAPELLPQFMRRVERLESRVKLLEDEEKGGIDLSKFYGPPPTEEGGKSA
jgi:hypothetical protein